MSPFGTLRPISGGVGPAATNGCGPVGRIMIKSELIQRVASANPHLFHRDVERIINIVLDEITSAVQRSAVQLSAVKRHCLATIRPRGFCLL